METSPLTSAHAHARQAALEFQKASGSAAASTEHELAATELSKVAATTHDVEALRIIKLLTSHHQEIASRIKVGPKSFTGVKVLSDGGNNVTLSTAAEVLRDGTISSSSPSQARSAFPKGPGQRRPHPDPSTSIAKNLASARGIPGSQQRRSTPVSPTVTVHTAVSNRDRRRTRDVSPSSAAEAARQQLRSDDDVAPSESAILRESKGRDSRRSDAINVHSDSPFNRFYSNVEGYISTLTGPLLFSGFGLGPSSEQQPAAPPAEKPRATTIQPSSQAEPDINTLFSRSTRRALRETNAIAAAESFYVVPTSGGTKSYAQMLSHSRLGLDVRPSSSADMEEFVDASETPYPQSPTRSKYSLKASATVARQTPTAGGKVRRGKTQEELELETHQQREIIDNLSKRLLAFETHSQSQRLALAQSMHSHRSPSRTRDAKEAADDAPPVPPLPKVASNVSETGSAAAKSGTDPLVLELQASLAALQRDNAKLARENKQKENVIDKYREKWEELKTAARKKARERQANAATAAQESESIRDVASP